MAIDNANLPRLERLPTVMQRTGRSKTSIYTDPSFPRPVRISTQVVAWVGEEVDAWIARQIARRDTDSGA